MIQVTAQMQIWMAVEAVDFRRGIDGLARVRRVGPNQAMVFYNMLPVYGSILGVILLGESLGAQHFIGGGLILSGSLISIWPELRTAAGKR